MELLHQAAMTLGLVWMAWIAITDFRTLKIRNIDVLILSAIGLVAVFSDPDGQWKSSLIVAVVLFAFSFALWATSMIGAGDAKFYFPLGLMVGLSGVGLYVVILLITSIAFLLLLRIEAGKPPGGGAFRQRLAVIAEKRRVPYGVPMAISGILAVLFA